MTDPTCQEAEFLLYQAEDGRTRVEVRFDGETAWLSLGQMAELFQRDKSVISRHVKNVFEEGELSLEATVAKSATTAADGKTYKVEYYRAAPNSRADIRASRPLSSSRRMNNRIAQPVSKKPAGARSLVRPARAVGWSAPRHGAGGM